MKNVAGQRLSESLNIAVKFTMEHSLQWKIEAYTDDKTRTAIFDTLIESSSVLEEKHVKCKEGHLIIYVTEETRSQVTALEIELQQEKYKESPYVIRLLEGWKNLQNFSSFTESICSCIEKDLFITCGFYIKNKCTDNYQLNRPEKSSIQELNISPAHALYLTHLFSSEEYEMLVQYSQKLFNKLLIPLAENEEVTGFFVLEINKGEKPLYWMDVIKTLTPILIKLDQDTIMKNEIIRSRLLLNVNKKLHSYMNTSDIFYEVQKAVKDAYPKFKVKLLLVNDWMEKKGLAAEHLDIQSNPDSPAVKAYLNAEFLSVNVNGEKKLFIPINGKQGVYGVGEITLPSDNLMLQHHDEVFLAMLADTAGIAIENADLYRQSRQYVEDLQVINSTSRKLNTNRSTKEVIKLMEQELKSASDADEAGVILIDKRWRSSCEMDDSSAEWQDSPVSTYLPSLIESVCDKREDLFIGRWEETEDGAPYQSIMGIPMFHGKDIIGAALIFGAAPYSFSFDTFKLSQSLVQHSALALVNAVLHEELKSLIITDYLTKLFTREHMDEQVNFSIKTDEEGSFFLFDIDHFKLVNDQYGHQTGDEVLIQTAQIIKEEALKHEGMGVRWGGEELALYVPLMDEEKAAETAETVRSRVEKETSPKVTISCGISHWRAQEERPSLTQLFAKADEAMYRAKSEGRNKVVLER
ncbi:sensor domain-containing diguanylate cyclase [Alkalicoccus daliensis]|uniref:Diguanylate cyclase (GGDEF) domain-containing protein n=1 Tax=Alkalicoccus daliensis TaxID=745820 RepID=A0A1H0C9Z7_9BACI|nr:GGDEF domain-containing protein [Alkalicoccus daliensis]SDN54705.1 diguanylate cyclase (GGDEF) domain-containing protein [Alkalicoccus daliensis]